MTELKTTTDEIYEAFNFCGGLTYLRKSLDELKQENFFNIHRVHDWRNYVMPFEIENWQNYSDIKRLLVYCQAVNKAEDEEWE